MADFFTNSDYVKELSPSDFDDINSAYLKDDSCYLVMFYCDWCGFCKQMKDRLNDVGKKAGFCTVAGFNCNTNPDHAEKIKHDMPNLIHGYPTIIIYKNHEPEEEYVGDRSEKDIIKTLMRIV